LTENGSIIPQLQKKKFVQDLYTNAIEETLYLEKNEPQQTPEDYKANFRENYKYFNNPDYQ